MSRNLCTSTCPDCPGKYTVTLMDIIGKPLEARRYGPYAPSFGTKWTCPGCRTAYFVIIRQGDKFWASTWDAHNAVDFGGNPNPNRGRFVHKYPDGHEEQTGYFVLDLSYYESFNDEHGPDPDERRHLLEDDAEDVQWVW